ncbi:hypothetical protein AB0D04_33705 [Streptomyces sp. NPDC048483]|uniref:hypothetical protein n=1 Tax=Streptomyces sp. NPDC048483 TaxID=3154927 RepID=UPI00342FCA7D
MDFILDPPTGIGPLRIGMPRDEADTAWDSLRVPDSLSPSDSLGQRIFRPSGLMISIDCMGGALMAAELWRPVNTVDRVLFRDIDVFALSAREVVELIGEHATVEEDPDDAASFVAPDLLLSLWRPFAGDDPDEHQGYYFSSVLMARPGYYDTPAEAEERRLRATS